MGLASAYTCASTCVLVLSVLNLPLDGCMNTSVEVLLMACRQVAE
jgi:hypothetical protein